MNKLLWIGFGFAGCLALVAGPAGNSRAQGPLSAMEVSSFRGASYSPNASTSRGATVLRAESYKHYIDSFNANDNELYPQYIPNECSWAFLSENIPLLDCPDREFEQTWYFRWWTYRKHIRKTPGGYVILEFLPDVEWAGKYNTINCAAALHVYEGRWLHDRQYVNDYEQFWYKGGGDMKAYSCWMADAIWNQWLVTGDRGPAAELEAALIANYGEWEKERLDSNGLYWQDPGKDGMEESICGRGGEDRSGYRATINSYMYADAMAIARIDSLCGHRELSSGFLLKAAAIKKDIQEQLWDPAADFFKVRSRGDKQLCTARELHGYTPWYFNIPPAKYSAAWKYLMDPRYFYAPFGPTTAEQGHPGFKVSYEGHECQWNGPSWPLATSITLTAMANLLNNYSQPYVRGRDYTKLLLNYARSHQRVNEAGKTVPWIDENLNPFTGDWLSRTRLCHWENGHWSAEKGGVERGKDYNHSTFCDLVITGLIGLRPAEGDRFRVNPLLPDGIWDYFCLDNILYHGRIVTILYDRTGNRYHMGKGLMVLIDGKKAAGAKGLQPLTVTMRMNN